MILNSEFEFKELKEKRNNFVNENEVKAKIEKSPTENETSSRNNTNDVIKSNENYSSITQATEVIVYFLDKNKNRNYYDHFLILFYY